MTEAARPETTALAIRAAMTVLAADGRPVTGAMLAEHFGVSARTGKGSFHYLAVIADDWSDTDDIPPDSLASLFRLGWLIAVDP